MHRRWRTIVVLGAAGLLAACGGQGSRALTGSQAPVTAPQQPGTAPPASSAPAATGPAAPSQAAVTSARTPQAARPTTAMRTAHAATTAPRPAGSTAVAPVATTPAPAAPCAGVTGSTTTIQEASGYRFVPSTVTIRQCDSVRAVYADATGAAHTWQGKTWNSGNMTSSSNSSYSYRFTSKGTFNFFCAYHQSFGMTGSVTVQ